MNFADHFHGFSLDLPDGHPSEALSDAFGRPASTLDAGGAFAQLSIARLGTTLTESLDQTPDIFCLRIRHTGMVAGSADRRFCLGTSAQGGHYRPQTAAI